MRVGLNCVFMVPGETGGMEVYAREVAPRLAAIDGLSVVAFVNREAGANAFGGDVETVVVPVHARRRAEWVRGEQQLLPGLARRAGCEVVHSLASTAPLWGRFARVTTIHDLHYRTIPAAHAGLLAHGMRVLVEGAARRSARLICDSEEVAGQLTTLLGADRARIDVVPLGVAAPVTPPTPAADLRTRLRIGVGPVVLAPGGGRIHKNLAALVDALAGLPEPRPAMVATGYPTEHDADLRARAAAAGVALVREGVDRADLEGLYALATLVCVPSLAEGFGLPVLEAMIRGVPVACSGTGALGEVAGDAAQTFDPTDVSAIRAAVAMLLAEPARRERLVARGRERAAGYSWDRTAAGTAAAYRRARRAGAASG